MTTVNANDRSGQERKSGGGVKERGWLHPEVISSISKSPRLSAYAPWQALPTELGMRDDGAMIRCVTEGEDRGPDPTLLLARMYTRERQKRKDREENGEW